MVNVFTKQKKLRLKRKGLTMQKNETRDDLGIFLRLTSRQLRRAGKIWGKNSKEQAIKRADEYARRTGLRAHVVRFRYGFDYVDDSYFRTYRKLRRVYYSTNPDELFKEQDEKEGGVHG